MKSKKDQGNDYFKKQKYEQAVKCYIEYVKADNPDNSKAYSNLALSYFRLKKYSDCVKACEAAVQIEPQFQKAFFRMYEAYKELNDYYGMLIAGQRFCKLSKDEKQIKTIQKDIPKIKESLSFPNKIDKKPTQNDRLVMQIINLENQSQKNQIIKEPQICLDAKWQKIQHLFQDNRRVGLNKAIQFLNYECKTEEDKNKYKKKIVHLNKIKNVSGDFQASQKLDSSQSSQEEAKVEQIKKYTAQLDKEYKKPLDQNMKDQNQIQKKAEKLKKQDKKQESKLYQAKKQVELQGKWQDFVKQQEAEMLFETQINEKLKKSQDQFTRFYELLMSLMRSTELNRFEKEAVLSVIPKKLKKFNMIMKSYTSKQKQQLAEVFAQNNLNQVMQQYYIKK